MEWAKQFSHDLVGRSTHIGHQVQSSQRWNGTADWVIRVTTYGYVDGNGKEQNVFQRWSAGESSVITRVLSKTA